MKSFKRVINTTNNNQIVEINIPPNETLGLEFIPEKQKITLKSGQAFLVSNKEVSRLDIDNPVYISSNSETDILNTSEKLVATITIEYSPARYHPRMEQTVKY